MDSKHRNWCFTLHNYTNDTIDLWHGILARKGKQIQHICWQGETCPTTGRAHLQGHVCFINAKIMRHVKGFFKRDDIHVEVMRGTPEQSYNYCTKDDSAIPGTRFEYGTLPVGQGTRTDLQSVIDSIKNGATNKDILDSNPQIFVQYRNGLEAARDAYRGVPRTSKTQIDVYYGESGTGKSFDAITNNPNCYILRKSATGVWFDGYDYQDTVVIDEFYDWIPFSQLLQLMDQYPMKVDIKGGAKEFNSKRIIITSNRNPKDWYKNLSYEHRIALLRRMDNVTYYSREYGKINVMDAVRKELDVLTKLTCNDKHEDSWVKYQRKIDTFGDNDDIKQELKCIDEKFTDVLQGNPNLEVPPLVENLPKTFVNYRKRLPESFEPNNFVPNHINYDYIERTDSGATYWMGCVPVWRYDWFHNHGASVRLVSDGDPGVINSHKYSWNYVSSNDEYLVQC